VEDFPPRRVQFDTLYSSAESSFLGVGYPSCSREISLVSPNNNDPNGYYRFLKLHPGASDRDIKKSIRTSYKQYHPEGWEPNEGLFIRTKEVAEVLLNPRLKVIYDSTPPGYLFSDSENKGCEVIDEIPIDEETQDNHYYHYFAFEPEVFDVELSQWWYETLVDVAPIFRYSRTVKVVLSNDQRPFFVETAGMFVIPRWWEPSTANAFALFSVLLGSH